MATNIEEPTAKRFRSADTDDDDDFRYIKLDMRNYGEEVRRLPAEDLVRIFEIGLKVRESLSVVVNQNVLEQALTSQMAPVKDTVANIESEVKQQLLMMQEHVTRAVSQRVNQMSTEVQGFKGDLRDDIHNIQQTLLNRVDSVVTNVPPLNILNEYIKQSEQRLVDHIQHIKPAINKCQDQLVEMSSSLKRSNVKGSIGEIQVMKVLKDRFGNFTITNVSAQRGKGDILVETQRQQKIMIEVKNRESNVPQGEIDRFKSDLESYSDVKVGILFSLKSGIAKKASNGKFQVKFNKNQYQIYVPNAGKDEALIIWSVLMADELAQPALHGELRSSQLQKLQQLCDEFQEIKGCEKTCRSNLDSLEKAAKALRENMNTMLKNVDETKKKLRKLLDSNATDSRPATSLSVIELA